MGRYKTTSLDDIFVEFPDKSQQFYKIRRECGAFPSFPLAKHYINRYGDKFFAHIYVMHYHSERGLDKCE